VGSINSFFSYIFIIYGILNATKQDKIYIQ